MLMKQISFSAAADQARIAYALYGSKAASKRFVLIHSLAMDHTFWEPVITALGDDVAVAALDARGHGQSDKPAGPYRAEGFADDVLAVLDDLAWPTAVIGGASMGGSVALSFAYRHPGRTAGLGLFDTTAWYGENAPQEWEQRGQKAMKEGLASLIPFQETRWFTDAFREQSPEVLAHCKTVFLANDLNAYLETCRMLGALDARKGIGGITAPTRILVGDEDYATPVSMAQALADGIPGARMEVLPQARHLSPLEYPETVAACLLELADAKR